MTIDQLLNLFFTSTGWVAGIAAGVYTWWKAQSNKPVQMVVDLAMIVEQNKARCAENQEIYRTATRGLLDGYNQRLTIAEEQLKNVPKSVELIALREVMARLEIAVSRLGGAQEEQTRMNNILHEHLLGMNRERSGRDR